MMNLVFDTIAPLVKDLKKECECLSIDEFERTREAALKEVQATDDPIVILVMRVMFTFIENELNAFKESDSSKKPISLSEEDVQAIREKNKFIDRLSDLERNMEKARILVGDLIQEYHLRDVNEMRDKLYYEAPKVMNFIEISFDYIYATHKEIVSLQEELSDQVDMMRERGL